MAFSGLSRTRIVGRMIGLLAMILGASGLILILAGGIAVWRLEVLVIDRCDRIANSVSNQLQRVEERVGRMERKVKTLTIDVEVVRAAAASLVQRAVQDVASPTELGELRERLRQLAVQTEELGATLELLAELVEDISELTHQFEANPERTERLTSIADSLIQADRALTAIREELATLPAENAADDRQKFTKLIEECHKPLERVAGALSAVRVQLDATRASLADVHQQLLNTIRMAAVLTSLLLGWFGLGQACLLGWGWKRFRKMSPSRGDE